MRPALHRRKTSHKNRPVGKRVWCRDAALSVADIAASGITLCQLLRISPEIIKIALPILKKYGLKVNIYENRITDLRRSRDLSIVDAVVKEVVEDYAAFDNIAGWDICDEPSADDFEIGFGTTEPQATQPQTPPATQPVTPPATQPPADCPTEGHQPDSGYNGGSAEDFEITF